MTEHLSTWLSHQYAVEVLREVVARCEEACIPVLPVKGVVTSRTLYDDVVERPIVDVDVRILPADFAAFRRMGRKATWKCSQVSWIYRNLIYDFPVLSLDVEGYVGAPGLCGLDVATMLSRARPEELVPRLRVLVPELHDHCVLLVVNAFKDKLVTARPGGLADLERIAGHPDFCRDVLVERVVEARVATLAWIVASWMESERGSAAWGAVRESLEARVPLRRRYARLFRRLAKDASREPMALRLLARAAADGRLMRAHALAGALAWQGETWWRRGFDAD